MCSFTTRSKKELITREKSWQALEFDKKSVVRTGFDSLQNPNNILGYLLEPNKFEGTC